ncbi:MAG: DUF418 domain-containing protein [Streptosporangiales bacterium]|nr:DUF418 domain-containing protein [Streptosporangiales bacterium]
MPSWSGPTALGERSLAPDLARGALLLFIALANSHVFLHGNELIRGYPLGGSALDSAVAGVLTTFVDGRSYTMFAALFGYGLVQIFRRQETAGADPEQATKLLRRRGRWMVVFGLLHAVLLFFGDIIAAYGMLAVIFAGALRWRDRTLLIWSGVFLLVGSAVYGMAALPMSGAENEMLLLEENPLVAAAYRGAFIVFLAPFGAITAVCSFLLGVWAARRRILEEPERHVPLLRRTAAVGIGVAVAGGLPLALLIAGVVPEPSSGAVWGLGTLHAATGYLGGPGYAAAIALLAVRIGVRRGRPGPGATAVAAGGQRSMTCYLSQSVVWMLVFPPYTAGLSTRLGVAATAVLAVGTWLLTVVLAEAMRQANLRGPFEVLLRRLTYGRRRASPR